MHLLLYYFLTRNRNGEYAILVKDLIQFQATTTYKDVGKRNLIHSSYHQVKSNELTKMPHYCVKELPIKQSDITRQTKASNKVASFLSQTALQDIA